MTPDPFVEQVKDAFIANPEALIAALGLVIDTRRSKGNELWVFDGGEDVASLHISAPKTPGLCYRFGDNWSGDCLSLVQRYRPQESFKQRLEFVANLYGVQRPPQKARGKRSAGKGAVIADTAYNVVSTEGEIIAIHRRQDHKNGRKTIWWETPDGEHSLPQGMKLPDMPLYRSHELALHPGKAVLICEGEKDTDAAVAAGFVAIGTYGADVTPSLPALQCLAERTVYLWPDNDAPGRKHMASIAQVLFESLDIRAYVLDWQDAPVKAGAHDWFDLGRTAEELRELAKAAAQWTQANMGDRVRANEHAMETAVDAAAAPMPSPRADFAGARPLGEIAGDIIGRVEEQRSRPRRIYGLRTGFDTFDWHTLGLARQTLILLLGESHAGKSTLARQMVFATADTILDEGSPARVVFYASEGGSDQFCWNYAAYKYAVPLALFQPGGAAQAGSYWAHKIAEAYERFKILPLDICEDDTQYAKILWDIERRAAEQEIAGVIIDNLQVMDFGAGNDYQNSKAAARETMLLSRKIGVPIVMLSQVNLSRAEGWNARGGPDWFNTADVVLYLERGDGAKTKEERALSNTSILLNPKFRHLLGCCRPIRLHGDKDTHRLWEESPQTAPIENSDDTARRLA